MGCKLDGSAVPNQDHDNGSSSSGSKNYRYFPDDAIWYQDISNSPLDSESAAVIAWLNSVGGWGNSNKFEVDFAMIVLQADSSTPTVPFSKRAGYYSPDCDNLTTFPKPATGAIEGETGYACTHGGDCHLLIVDKVNKRLYESYNSNFNGTAMQSICGIMWDLSRTYPITGRGDQCTSTDAAGYPVAPLLFNADEVASGEIDHAIRFILPNNRMRKNVYVRPATHAGAPSASSPAPIYGMRFRLKSSFDVSTLKPAAQVVARALQKYGMLLADGGQVPLTAESDRFTTNKWADLDFGALDLNAIRVTDFEVVDAGSRVPLTFNCVRNP
jgi:serine/threonine-protein kinase